MADFVLIDISHLMFTRALPLACRLVHYYLDLHVLLSFGCVQQVHARGVRRGRSNIQYNNATHYVKLGKKIQKNSKRN